VQVEFTAAALVAAQSGEGYTAPGNSAHATAHQARAAMATESALESMPFGHLVRQFAHGTFVPSEPAPAEEPTAPAGDETVADPGDAAPTEPDTAAEAPEVAPGEPDAGAGEPEAGEPEAGAGEPAPPPQEPDTVAEEPAPAPQEPDTVAEQPPASPEDPEAAPADDSVDGGETAAAPGDEDGTAEPGEGLTDTVAVPIVDDGATLEAELIDALTEADEESGA
jgi:hypothetical protein